MRNCPEKEDPRVFAIARIRRTGGFIDMDNVLTHPKPGLKVWAAIDYLVNYCHSRWGGELNPWSHGEKKRGKRR